jgi:hypothetical protein
MLDIHPAHHAATTWRDFFIHIATIHIATIVFGLLIAIGLEQTVEYFHHRHLAAEARRALIEERKTNESSNGFNIFATRRHQQDLQRDLTILHALQAHQPPPSFHSSCATLAISISKTNGGRSTSPARSTI